jgi:NADPH2:quinone reductase
MATSIPATMCALQQTSLNGPQDLRLITDVPVPAPGPGDVLIRVTAAGVNFGDISQAHGVFLGGPQPPYPSSPRRSPVEREGAGMMRPRTR